MIQIKCENVSLSYDGHSVLSSLSFEVNRGDFLCVVGENGSGKSTLIKAILGLKNVSAGSIRYFGSLNRSKIGYLPQQRDNQKDFPAGVGEIVLSGTLNDGAFHPFYSKNDKLRALGAMQRLGIESLKKHSFRELSGGQQQRVLLCRALCATKELLLLDEPASGLDPIATAGMYELIKKINSEGITVIMVSHDIPAAVKYASHVLHLHDSVRFFGTTADYLKSPDGKRFIGFVEGGERQ